MIEFVGIIPVREGSKRVEKKNFREFSDKKSLLEIKINQLKKTKNLKHIYISSDSKQAEKIAIDNDVEFLKRDTKMCQVDVYWAEVISYIVDTIPKSPYVVWALTTSPLFSRFDDAVDLFKEKSDEYDSLIATLPKKTFFLNKDGKGINYNPGYWHPYSQQLETYYEVTGACYIGKKTDMKKWAYWFGPKPYLFNISELEAVDIDTQNDFEFAKKLYKNFR